MQNLARSVPLPVRQRAYAVVPAPVWRTMRRMATGQTRPQAAWRRARTGVFHLRSGQRSARTAAIEVQGHTYVALRTSTFRSSTVIARHLTLVADAFEKHDVPYFVLDAQTERRRVVVVAEEHRAEALAALQAELRAEPTYLARVRDKAIDSPRLVGRLALPRSARVVRVFQVLVSDSGSFLGGPVLGCDVEFWHRVASAKPALFNGEPIPAGTLVAPRRNPWADVIIPTEQKTVRRPVDGVPRPVLDTIAHPHLFTVTEPIDVVYTWVDGSDPAWLARKAAAQDEYFQRTGVLHALAANDSRFASRDELRYSLRSLDMYADWVRHVYLVTDNQVPAWLDTSNPRLTVVTPRELFGDRGRLPTFNSHAIESQLHRIDGLSEHYLYLNDDVFFGRPVSPSLLLPQQRDRPVLRVEREGRARQRLPRGHAGDERGQEQPRPGGEDVRPHHLQQVQARPARPAPVGDARHGAGLPRRLPAHRARRRSATTTTSPSRPRWRTTTRTPRVAPCPARSSYLYADIARDDTANRLTSLLRRRDVDVFCLNDHDSEHR